ncbi:phosphatase PAP2 family protein [Streptomyces sp. P38-E01]|uniref:Phosphatase PAP2 family protein n=1 Tax=Streptomyces tardus TaxID=2780544 RepID=A0A949N0J4_9ACTN|nr:phosphatase PAP2 family protein [Streptomyces tardus]
MSGPTVGGEGADDGSPSEGRAFARRVTDGLEPKNWIVAVTLIVGWWADGPAGLAWGAFGVVFAAVLPVLFIKYGIRRGSWADRHLGVRQHRLVVMPFIVGSVLLATLLMRAFDAPSELTALIASMVAAMAVLLVVTVWWKVSVHSAVSSGSVVVLALTCGPLLWAGFVLVALVGWSRVSLRDHTPAQVLVGTVLGGAVAGVVFTALR